MLRLLTLTALLAVSACGSDDSGGGAGADDATGTGGQGGDLEGEGGAGNGGTAATGGATCGSLPAPDAPWIEEYQTTIVGKLSGHEPIAAGLDLTERASEAARDATRTFLLAELAALGVEAELAPYDGGASGANVVAKLPGSDEHAAWIIAGAHFDGVPAGPAAADNATGAAIVLSLARYLSAVSCRDMNVLLVFFDQEELGLIGSQALVEQLEADRSSVEMVHNFDMISWDADGDGAVELWSPAPPLASAYAAAGAERGVEIEQVDFDLSDHASFAEAGFLSVGVSELFVTGDSTPYYHTANDTFDNVDFGYLARTTGLIHTVLGRQVAR